MFSLAHVKTSVQVALDSWSFPLLWFSAVGSLAGGRVVLVSGS